MGKGRAPCCDKSKVKRGPWSPQEDLQLIAFVQKHGHENWRALPKQAGLQRCGKSCRLRWINYLRPDVKRGNFTTEEEETIIRLHKAMGNKWSKIASCLPGRTDNEIKNVWNTHLKKRLDVVKTSESSADESKIESSITSSSSSSSESILSNEIPNLVAKTTTPSSELNEENFQVTMIDETMKESEKELTNEVIGIIEEPKGSSKTSLTSNESNVLNSNHIVGYKTEQQLGSPLPYLGPYDIENVLEEVDQPNQLLEIPWEDYDLWKLLDNTDEPFQSNEVQLGELPMPENPNHNFVQEGVQNVDSMEWSFDFENEFGANEIKDSNKDETLPKNYEVEPQRNPFDGFDFNDMTKPASEFDLDYIQLWPSWPQNPSF